MKIFRFETEEQLNNFDKKYNFSGCLDECWIYGEGTDNWFSIQHCGNRWSVNFRINEKFENFIIYPENYNEFIKSIEKIINN